MQNLNKNVTDMKQICLLVLMLVLVILNGCSVPGSAGQPTEDDSVTIRGIVSVPQVAAPGFLAATGTENSAAAFARFLASSTCLVNGTNVAFSLSSTTRELVIEKLPPAVVYSVELHCGFLKLKSFVANTGRHISLPFGISLRSSADWYLRTAIASHEGLRIDQLNEYGITAALLDLFAASMQNELNKADSSSGTVDTLINNSTTSLLAGKTFADCLQKSGNAFAYNGNFSGQVFYYALNSSGNPELAVKANAEMTCSQSGQTVTGTLDIEPVAVVPLVENPTAQSPSTTSFAFLGTANGSFLSFARKGLLGPLNGKTLDNWFVFPVTGGLAVRAENLDKSYYTGIQTKPGDFILERK